MRALVIAEDLDRPETHILLGLAARNVDITLLLPPGATARDQLDDVPFDVRPIRLNGRIDLEGIRTIRRTVKEQQPALVHCLRSNRPLANALLALRGLPTPIICYRGTMGNLGRWDPGSRLTYLSRKLSRIVCVSDAVRNDLLTLGIPSAKLVTIYKGHDPGWYQSDPVDLHSEFNIPADALIVGCAANMRPLKGAHVLIEAMRHLATNRRVHLLLIGEVRDPQIHALCDQEPFRDLVHLAGFRTDAAALSGSCDLFVMPTLRREGLPRAVIEAMSQSVPPIVTNVGGMPELVQDGRSGLVVPPGDPEALAAAISDLANDDARRSLFASTALRRIETEFHVTTSVDRTLSLYRSLS